MANDSSSVSELASPRTLWLSVAGLVLGLPSLPAGAHEMVLVTGGLVLTALVALLDCVTGPELSFGIFYLIPVAACAWWGGFAQGTLLALCGAVARYMVESAESPALSAVAGLWNGVVAFGTFVLASSLVARLHVGIRRERQLARTDPLTGAANGRTFYEAAAAEANRAERMGRALTLAYMDLDGFKQLNDQMGHAAGDAALRQLVHAIQATLRNSDLLARLGGDEFALLLPETEALGAATLLARLQQGVVQAMTRGGWPVSLSVGAATFLRPPRDVDLMVRRVDALMYVAKGKGKGRVEHAVVRDADGLDHEQVNWLDRRATARVLSGQAARVRREGPEVAPQPEFATVRDVSPGGLSLCLDEQLPPETVLVVEALLPGAQTLLARVLHATPEGNGWRHGCELSTRLNTEELHRWLGEQQGRSP